MQRPFFLFLLLLGGTALAGRDSGTVSNWARYADQLEGADQTGGFGPYGSPSEFNMLRAIFKRGQFSVTFDDNLAARFAQASPSRQNCPAVQRTQDLRTTLISGIVVKSEQGLNRVTREGQSGSYKVSDVWVYATKTGVIKGSCQTGNATAQYNLALRQGWNVVRVYNDDTRLVSIVQNIQGRPLPWAVR